MLLEVKIENNFQQHSLEYSFSPKKIYSTTLKPFQTNFLLSRLTKWLKNEIKILIKLNNFEKLNIS